MEHRARVAHDVLDAQHQHWEQTLAQTPEMFGDTPSEAARKAAEVFNKAGVTTILELGGGQGRDTIFCAQSGFHVSVLDYAESGVHTITQKAHALGLSPRITALQHDVRTSLPFEDDSFEACYSHMLYCMALTSHELESLYVCGDQHLAVLDTCRALRIWRLLCRDEPPSSRQVRLQSILAAYCTLVGPRASLTLIVAACLEQAGVWAM